MPAKPVNLKDSNEMTFWLKEKLEKFEIQNFDQKLEVLNAWNDLYEN